MRHGSIACVLASLALSAAARADVIAAQWGGDGFLGSTIGLALPGSFTNTAAGQTFLSHATGTLHTLSARVGRGGFESLIVRVYASNGTTPGAVLGQLVFPWYQVPTNGSYFPMDFSAQSIHIEAGQSYAFTVSTERGVQGGSYGLGGDSVAGYAEGNGVQSFNDGAFFQNSYDYSFIVMVTPPPPPACPADFNGDGTVNADDLGDFITCYFTVPACDRAEFNGDGAVNADDLGDFITTYFGPAC